MAAERAAGQLPLARLADVTRHGDEIFGVVHRPSELLSEETYSMKAWLLRLNGIETGDLQWDDFHPSCKSCKAKLLPVAPDEQSACPVCRGQKGPGKCLQFACRPTMFSCGCPGSSDRRAYCGSHPFFGGYAFEHQLHRDTGPGLWEQTMDVGNLPFEVTMAASRHFAQEWLTEVHLFIEDLEEMQCLRVQVREDNGKENQSILTPKKLRMGSAPWSPVSSAVVLAETWANGVYVLVQRFGNSTRILRRAPADNLKWTESAELPCPDVCKDFKKQIVELRGETSWHSYLGRFVGLSKKSLWLLEVPREELHGAAAMTAQQLASKVSWRKLLDLPDMGPQDKKEQKARPVEGAEAEEEPAEDLDEEFEDEEVERLLAPGPRGNQVIIFAPEGSALKPWLLVELSGWPLGADVRTARLTSTASVPLKTEEGRTCRNPFSFHIGSSRQLLPSVIRVGRRHSGYLFFGVLGEIYRLRDEEITLAEHAWIPPSFGADGSQRVVTFTFPDCGTKRSCLSSVLARFEYFQTALKDEHWQEGGSAEICVADAEPELFDVFLAYLHTGQVGRGLPLETLLRILQLANKYVIHHLMAVSMAQILRSLDDAELLRAEEPTVLADLLVFGDRASCCGALKVKIMDAIACSRPNLVLDTGFLARASGSSIQALSQLLASLVPPEGTYFRVEAKRRKTQELRRDSLWREASGAPGWSATC